MTFLDPGCDFIDAETDEKCGRTPSRPVHVGISADPTKGPAYLGVHYRRFCEDHYPETQPPGSN
jgi:hypothetical protein